MVKKIFFRLSSIIVFYIIFLSFNLYGEDSFFLQVKADFKRERATDEVFISGKTNLPDNSKILIDLNTPKANVAKRRAYVKNGKFNTQISLLKNNRLIPWKYSVEAVFIPSVQNDKKVLDVVGGLGSNINKVTSGEIIKKNLENKIVSETNFLVGTKDQYEKALSDTKNSLIKSLKEIEDIFNKISNFNIAFEKDKADKEERAVNFNLDLWKQKSEELKLKVDELYNEYSGKDDFIKRFPDTENVIRNLATNMPRLLKATDRKFNKLQPEKINLGYYESIESADGYLKSLSNGIVTAKKSLGIYVEEKK